MRLDSYRAGLGRLVVCSPEGAVTAGDRPRVELAYTVGKTPITAGGAVRFRLPGVRADDDGSPVVRCSREGAAELRLSNALPSVNGKDGREFPAVSWYLFVVVTKGKLRPGDTLTVAADEVRLPTWTQHWAVEAAVDPDGTRPAPRSGFYLLPDPPTVEIAAGAPTGLELTVPSTVQCGEPAMAVLRARDRCHNVVRGYTSGFAARLISPGAERPVELRFGLNSEGVLVCPDLRVADPGVWRVEVTDLGADLRALSNPLRATPGPPATRLFWGDTHCHSTASGDTSLVNESITPEADYRYARHVAHLDFCAVTDHSENLHVAPKDWNMVRQAAADAYEPGVFVTFSAYESTHQPQRGDGDKNVYFLDDDQPCVTEGTTEETYAALRRGSGRRVMVIPHLHVPPDWRKHDPELEHVVEVYSHWGCGLSPESEPQIVRSPERFPENYVSHALEQGARLGFIASGDHSFGHPGDDFWWGMSSFNGGLAAIYSAELMREGLWEALKSRSCYGTTRARILLDFALNGQPMGRELVLPADQPRRLSAEVHGTSPIRDVRLIRNGHVIHAEPGDDHWDVELEFEDPRPERDTDYYYVHVRQEDGEQAWSSPIWVQRVPRA